MRSGTPSPVTSPTATRTPPSKPGPKSVTVRSAVPSGEKTVADGPAGLPPTANPPGRAGRTATAALAPAAGAGFPAASTAVPAATAMLRVPTPVTWLSATVRVVPEPLTDTTADADPVAITVTSAADSELAAKFASAYCTVNVTGPRVVCATEGPDRVIVGGVVSTTRRLFAPREPAAPGAGRVSTAGVAEPSWIVPPLSARAFVPVASSRGLVCPGPTT